MIIIPIAGKAQHGKDSTANILKEKLEQLGKRVLVIAYADYLKYIATKYFNWNGQKDKAGRDLLQRLGTEKIRTKNPNFWVNTVINLVQVLEDDFDCVLISDARFWNEIENWYEQDYRIFPIHVTRLNFDNGLTDEQKQHSSETALNGYDFSYYLFAENLTDLEIQIDEMIEKASLV